MKIIEQLNKLPIRSGEYLVLPNLSTPYFIVPLHSRRTFIDAISFVKSKNLKGNIKRNALKFIPIFILKRLFSVISIQAKDCDNHFHQLILPWNQDVCNKFTVFNFNKNKITLLKIGFKNFKGMIRNEYESILKVPNFGKDIIPEIISFREDESFTKIETLFYDGIHPNYLPVKINDFFERIKAESPSVKMNDHPYVNRIVKVINDVLKKECLDILFNSVNTNLKKLENELVSVVLMHGDCSKTNVISKNGRDMLIDWEDCIIDGVPIDIGYFDFRMFIDDGKSWKVETKIDFLVVLHYIYLQIKNDNIRSLYKISFKDSIFSL
jgi:hypothetical protein